MAVRFPEEGNPYFPLPPDYPELGAEGQRLARVNAVRLRETPEDFVTAWSFFREWYLGWDGAFFYDDFRESPLAHYEWAWFRFRHRRNAIGAHRGMAKSTVIGTEWPLMDLVSQPRSKSLLVLSTDAKVEARFDNIMYQLERNDRILSDFGQLKPLRGAGIWNRHHLRLENGAQLLGGSVNSVHLRGERPHTLIVDDPEYDPKEGTDLEKLTADFETLLFKVLLGMLRGNARMFWIGTLITRRSFLWKILRGEDQRVNPKLWNRRVYPMVGPDGLPLWKAEFTQEQVEEKKQELGAGFWSEMMCDPGLEEDPVLRVGPNSEWTTAEIPSSWPPPDPRSSDLIVKRTDIIRGPNNVLTPTPASSPLKELLASQFLFTTTDYAPTQKDTSDFSAIAVMGADRLNQVWLWDLWAGKVRSSELIRRLWEMAIRWRVRVMGVEAVGVQEELVQLVSDAGVDVAERLGWVPQVIPIRYPAGVSKAQRIGALEWRFDKGLIKLPGSLRNREPFRSAYWQIQNYTPTLCRLEHDDLADVIAMSSQILKGSRPELLRPERELSLFDRIRNGETVNQFGMPLSTLVPLNQIPSDIWEILRGEHEEAEISKGRPLTWRRAGL